MRFSSLKLSRQADFRSPPKSLHTQVCAATGQPSTGSASQQYLHVELFRGFVSTKIKSAYFFRFTGITATFVS